MVINVTRSQLMDNDHLAVTPHPEMMHMGYGRWGSSKHECVPPTLVGGQSSRPPGPRRSQTTSLIPALGSWSRLWLRFAERE
jgi:hypothetical protein